MSSSGLATFACLSASDPAILPAVRLGRAQIEKITAVHGGCDLVSTPKRLALGVGLSSYARFGSQHALHGTRVYTQRCRPGKRRAAGEGDKEASAAPGGFWEGEEGKRKLQEIEEMRELLQEAAKMVAGPADGKQGGGAEVRSEEEIARERAEKMREELARKARELAERRKEVEALFAVGQRAYGKGVYDKSVEILEEASAKCAKSSQLGGEIQIWLAMAYDANNRHADCISLYKRLEGSHPSKAIRRQAADLRYILEAPRLKISRDEMVTVPVLDRDNKSNARTWSDMVRERKPKPLKKAGHKDYMDDWSVWKRPRWERSPYFWVALTVWFLAVGFTLLFQN